MHDSLDLSRRRVTRVMHDSHSEFERVASCRRELQRARNPPTRIQMTLMSTALLSAALVGVAAAMPRDGPSECQDAEAKYCGGAGDCSTCLQAHSAPLMTAGCHAEDFVDFCMPRICTTEEQALCGAAKAKGKSECSACLQTHSAALMRADCHANDFAEFCTDSEAAYTAKNAVSIASISSSNELTDAIAHLEKETATWCETLQAALPAQAPCLLSDDCFRFECEVDVLGTPLLVGANLDLCNAPATATVYVDTRLVDRFEFTLNAGTP